MTKDAKPSAEPAKPALKSGKRGMSSAALALFAAVFAFLLIFAVYAIFGYAPFGSRALLYSDADYQYFDLVLYYKRVFAGQDSFFYSFGKSMGGNNYAVFAYYLASPVMLLSLLFKAEDTALCLNVMSAVKIAMAAATAAYALSERFGDREEPRSGYAVLIAVSYGLSQYMVSQTCNMMWLDGAVMLPLVLLGTYRVVKGRNGLLLCFSVALSLIFNWYTGIINCMFSAFWLLFEIALCKAKLIKSALRYAAYMMSGILTSGIVLLPALLILSDRTHGSGGIKELLMPGFIGNPASLISNYAAGVVSVKGYCSLFAGSLVLLGAILFFFSKAFEKRTKAIVALMLLFTLMTYVFRPLVTVFSIFRNVESYWYRYSYTGIFLLSFIAAAFFLKCEEIKPHFVILSGSFFALLSVLFSLLFKEETQNILYGNNVKNTIGIKLSSDIIFAVSKVALPLAFTLVLFLVFLDKHGVGNAFNVAIVAIFTSMEMVLAGGMLFRFYSNDKAEESSSYVLQETELVSRVKEFDPGGIYRVEQTSERSKASTGNTANFNEGLGYGFKSISSFVSDPEEVQGEFLAKLGYPFHSETITVTASPIIPADSLVGVKYVLSEYDIPGMEKITTNSSFKNAYRNPYCLPPAFVCSGAPSKTISSNPFEYQNEVYSAITGEKINIFTPVDHMAVKAEKQCEFKVEVPEGNYVLYGRFIPGANVSADTDINGVYKLTTGKFLSPDVFVVLLSSGSKTASVTAFTGKEIDAEFYLLDLDLFGQTVKKIESKAASVSLDTSGSASILASSEEDGEKLFVWIPYDSSWKVEVNGKEVVPETFGGCMTLVPLVKGRNNVIMEYRAPHMKEGIISTAAGLLMTIPMAFIYLKKKKAA